MAKRKPLSASVQKTLRTKANKSRFTYGTLSKVFRRGQGAFLTSGSRPGIGMNQWAMARVNSATPSKPWACVKKSKAKKKK